MLFRKLFRMLVLGGAAIGTNARCSTAQAQQRPRRSRMVDRRWTAGPARRKAPKPRPTPGEESRAGRAWLSARIR